MNEANANNVNFSKAALEHLDALYGFAMVLTHNQTEAEDLVQETYLRAARAFGNLLPDSNIKNWLFTIMRNIRLNQLRHARSGPQFVELDREQEGESLAHNPHVLLVSKIESESVRAAIERLPRLFREAILLRDIEGFSYQQIAAILECPAGTVMSRLARAREQLRLLLCERQVSPAQK